MRPDDLGFAPRLGATGRSLLPPALGIALVGQRLPELLRNLAGRAPLRLPQEVLGLEPGRRVCVVEPALKLGGTCRRILCRAAGPTAALPSASSTAATSASGARAPVRAGPSARHVRRRRRWRRLVRWRARSEARSSPHLAPASRSPELLPDLDEPLLEHGVAFLELFHLGVVEAEISAASEDGGDGGPREEARRRLRCRRGVGREERQQGERGEQGGHGEGPTRRWLQG